MLRSAQQKEQNVQNEQYQMELEDHADRVCKMEFIKSLTDELLEFSEQEPELLQRVCSLIKELSDEVIEWLFENAEWESGVTADVLKCEVAAQYIATLAVTPKVQAA